MSNVDHKMVLIHFLCFGAGASLSRNAEEASKNGRNVPQSQPDGRPDALYSVTECSGTKHF